jgi:hypothetical protein
MLSREKNKLSVPCKGTKSENIKKKYGFLTCCTAEKSRFVKQCLSESLTRK